MRVASNVKNEVPTFLVNLAQVKHLVGMPSQGKTPKSGASPSWAFITSQWSASNST